MSRLTAWTVIACTLMCSSAFAVDGLSSQYAPATAFPFYLAPGSRTNGYPLGDAQQHLSEHLAVLFQQSGVVLKPTVLRPTKFTEEALTKLVVGIGQLPVSDSRDRIRFVVVGQIVKLNCTMADKNKEARAEVELTADLRDTRTGERVNTSRISASKSHSDGGFDLKNLLHSPKIDLNSAFNRILSAPASSSQNRRAEANALLVKTLDEATADLVKGVMAVYPEMTADEGTDELTAPVRLAIPVTGATKEESASSALAAAIDRMVSPSDRKAKAAALNRDVLSHVSAFTASDDNPEAAATVTVFIANPPAGHKALPEALRTLGALRPVTAIVMMRDASDKQTAPQSALESAQQGVESLLHTSGFEIIDSAREEQLRSAEWFRQWNGESRDPEVMRKLKTEEHVDIIVSGRCSSERLSRDGVRELASATVSLKAYRTEDASVAPGATKTWTGAGLTLDAARADALTKAATVASHAVVEDIYSGLMNSKSGGSVTEVTVIGFPSYTAGKSFGDALAGIEGIEHVEFLSYDESKVYKCRVSVRSDSPLDLAAALESDPQMAPYAVSITAVKPGVIGATAKVKPAAKKVR